MATGKGSSATTLAATSLARTADDEVPGRQKQVEREFKVGDWVYLKLWSYIQKSFATKANPKLAFKFYGPYKILRRIGMVAYELQLPATSSVHPVFHISQLKYAVGQ